MAGKTRVMRRWGRGGEKCGLGLVIFGLLLCTPGRLSAQDDPCQPRSGLSTCVASNNVWPHPGAGRWMSLAPAHALAAGALSVGLSFAYLSRPIGLRMASPDPEGITVYAVDDVLDATFLTALGITDRLQLNVAVPTVLYQDGAGTADVLGSDDHLPRTAVGDVRAGLALAVLQRREADDGAALASRLTMSIPTGDRLAFVSARTMVFTPGVSFEHRVGRFCWSADAAARIRGESQLADARIGTQLFTGLGASVDILADQWLSVGLEGFALFTLAAQGQPEGSTKPEPVEGDEDQALIPAEWLLSVRSAGMVDGRLAASLAGGGSIPTGPEAAVTTPSLRFMAAIHYLIE